MGRPCMRCGADMILGCAVRTAGTFKLTDESSIYVQNGGMYTGRERPLYLAVCPDCGKELKIFGESHLDEIAKEYEIEHTAKLPIDSKLSAAMDKGSIELFEGTWLAGMADMLAKL